MPSKVVNEVVSDDELKSRLEAANSTINSLLERVKGLEEEYKKLDKKTCAYRDALINLAKEIN